MLCYVYKYMAYVTSGTFAHQVMGHWTCALESGPLIGVPPLEIAGGKRASPAGRAVRLSSQQRQTCL